MDNWRVGSTSGATGSTPDDNSHQYGIPLARSGSSVSGLADMQPFDPMDFAKLSPSALDPSTFNPSFVMPRFATNTTKFGGYDVAVVDPDRSSRDLSRDTPSFGSFANDFFAGFNADPFTPSAGINPSNVSQQPAVMNTPSSSAPTPLPPAAESPYNQHGPVYAPYGSSVVSVNPSVPFKMPPISMPPSAAPTQPFSPGSLGLPVPPAAGTSTNFAGLYSSSGFDMISVLVRVAARPNPTINIGPVDTSCSFLVVDAKKYDFPIVFVSETFTRLTGYKSEEIIGKNCRFLQSPDGVQSQGQPRKYTDSHAAWHMRQHLATGKESQSSLINYQKGGKAFINLVTIIPISWDNTDEIAYYVGFQVDLVDQPNAILDRMRDGSYVVNYSLLNNPPKGLSMLSSLEEAEPEPEMLDVVEEKPFVPSVDSNASKLKPNDMLSIIENKGVGGLVTEDERRQWHKLIFENSEDLVHVLSLKGSILYCSPSASKILEYEPGELVGRTIQSVCHPSDIVPVMRELKEAGSIAHPYVSLLYRVQRKRSGYIWLEATGKLHIEPGKGRKSVILVGRPRAVLSVSWKDVRQVGGLGDREFWTKMSVEGMVLSSTQAVQDVLGFSAQDMVGTSLHQLIRPESEPEIRRALAAANGGRLTTVQHKLRSRNGFVDVVTRFYPCEDTVAKTGDGLVPPHSGIVAQTTELSSWERKTASQFVRQAPELYTGNVAESPVSDIEGQAEGSQRFSSTFKTLTHPSVITDNVFDELDKTRCTSWQYELHQLQNLNKRLREEHDYLLDVAHKRPADLSMLASRGNGNTSESSRTSRTSAQQSRSCANCGRLDSPEWRAGPTGLRTLCNACGVRWAKTQKERSQSLTADPASNPFGALSLGGNSTLALGGNGGMSSSEADSSRPSSAEPMQSPVFWT